MPYILWGFLNITVFICFVVVCFKATKIIREKWGMITALLFVLGMFSFIASPDNDNKAKDRHQIATWDYTSMDDLVQGSVEKLNIELEDRYISKLSLGILYGKDKNTNRLVPKSANTYSSGFISGTSWNPISILVNTTAKEKIFTYEVYGVIKWQLLNLTLYGQPKHWEGTLSLK